MDLSLEFEFQNDNNCVAYSEPVCEEKTQETHQKKRGRNNQDVLAKEVKIHNRKLVHNATERRRVNEFAKVCNNLRAALEKRGLKVGKSKINVLQVALAELEPSMK